MKSISVVALFVSVISAAEDWPQGGGPSGDFQIEENHPTEWSVALDQNIAWKVTLPETGQSTPIVSNGKVFFSTMKQVQKDTKLASDIVAWCVDAKSGKVQWKRPIPGPYPLRISGAFSDSSSPPAVCDGERVVFSNASGTIVCFDLIDKTVWKRDLLTVGLSIPFLHDGKLIYTSHSYPPEEGKFPHTHKDEPFQKWTKLQALNIETGEEVWTTSCGVNMGCAILPQRLSDGRSVALVGRRGGHSPPERPEGVSLVNLNTGTTMCTLPLEGYMSTQTNLIRNDKFHIFHKASHLTLNAVSGQIEKQVSIIDDISTRKRSGDAWTSTRVTLESKKGRMITQGSNLLVGNYHYYRSYTSPYLGPVNVDTGAVEHLELPLQLSRVPGDEEQFKWYVAPRSKNEPEMRLQAFAENDMINSRGYVVFDDARSKGNGWGHIAAPTMSVAGDYLYIPVMSGTVYVIRHDVNVLNESAIEAVNDLGPVGKSWTRASLSFSNGKVFAHTIRELIAIGN